MICRFSVENFKAFAERIEIDFYANKNIKRFDYNYTDVGDKGILKTSSFYGPNNTGKTCIILALASLRALMLNEKHDSFYNAFANKGNVTSFSVEYFVNGRFYVYSVEYDNQTKQYLSESLFLKKYNNGSSSNEKIFERTGNTLSWKGITNDFKRLNIIKIFSISFPFMVMFNDDDNLEMKQAKQDYFDFANSLLFLKMDGPVDVSKTIYLMQNDEKAANFIKDFVKNCDLHINDFGFDENVTSDTNIDEQIKDFMNNPGSFKESLKLYSTHNGYRVPSIFFDSVGTLKLIALAGYIYDALKNGKTLLVDEIDSSLHHILTKAIVAMFSNMLNKKSQLLFTTHDALLLNLKELFRKDQIWLVDILNSYSSKVIRLSEFTSRSDNGIRGDEDIIEYYLKGQFGSIPTPDLFSSLEEAVIDD